MTKDNYTFKFKTLKTAFFAAGLALASVGTSYGQTLLSADFTGQTLPAGWSNTVLGTGTPGQVWEFNNPYPRTITGGTPGFDGDFAILDSDNYGDGGTQDAALETPAFDASTASGAIFLNFDQQMRVFSGAEGNVEVWNGSVWTTVLPITSSDGYPNPANHKNIDITAACGGFNAAKVRFHYTGSWDYWWALDNISVDVVSCTSPTGLASSAVGTTTATISWTAVSPAPALGYLYYYNTSGVAPTASTAASGSSATASANLTGLAASTTYYAWVRSVCSSSDTSDWSASSTTFTTSCLPVSSLPWTENFDGLVTVGSTSFPNCWTKQNGFWETSNATSNGAGPNSGANYLRDWYSATNEFMWTPGFTLTAGTQYEFSFYAQDGGYTNPDWILDVFTNTSADSTGASALGTTYVTPGDGTYHQVKYYFTPSTNGVYYFALRVNGTINPWYYSFDDFKLQVAPLCTSPSSATASNITSTSAKVSWSSVTPTPTNGYGYYYNTTNTAPTLTTPSMGYTADTFTNLSSLTGSTTYYFWVRSRCSSSDSSDWTSASFTTPPANDACADAQVLTCGASAVNGTTVGSAPETVPTGGSASQYGVWYKFAGTGDNVTVTSLAGAGFDHEILVYSGACGTMTFVGSVDLNGSGGTETYTFTSTIGTDYYIYIAYYGPGGSASNTGTFNIGVTCAPPPAMAYVSSTVSQSSTSVTFPEATDQQIVRLSVVVSGASTPLTVSQIDFNTTGNVASPTPSDIIAARIYYTGTSSTFATTTQFGSDIATPSGSASITGSQALIGGSTNTTNYFWLVYDIAPDAIVGDTVDAAITSVTVGTPQTPTITNPTGKRAIAAPVVNDEASGAIALTVGAGCTGAAYTNVNATASATEPTSPITSTTNTSRVWYKFVAPASGAVRVTTDVNGTTGTLIDSRVTLFSATNPSNYSTFTALSADDDGGRDSDYGGTDYGFLSTMYATGLTAGTTYYVMVSGWSGTTSGTFCLTVDELDNTMISTTNTCDSAGQDPAGSLSTYTGQVSLIDQYGKLMAIVQNPAGGSAYDYSSQQNIHSGAIRTDAFGTKYLDRNFLISNSTATNVNVQLFFLDSELGALGTTLGALNVTHVTGSTCTPDFAGGTASLITQSGSGSANGVDWVSFTTPSFSNFFLNTGTNPLPITLGNIHAANIGAANIVKWNTVEEKDNATFELERSADSRTFVKIATMQAKGIASDYSYTDTKPFNNINYYRLKMINNDGSSTYSDIVSAIVKSNNNFGIATYPNPTDRNITLNISGKIVGEGTVTVTDITGKVILVKDHITNNEVVLSFDNLAAGIYLLKYTDNENAQTIKITKQ